MDVDAISRTVRRKLKERMFGKSKYGYHEWKKADFSWYNDIHNSNIKLHEDFIRYLSSKKDIQTVLEIGCGAGVYPIRYKHLFDGLSYTGLDFSQEAIDYCKKNSKHNFLCGDFLKMDITEKYDLVYSHAVIDHVYDVDSFISKICFLSKKYAYINAYRGYYPNLKKHNMTWRDDDGCYYNDISLELVRKNLFENGLREDEFIIRPQENGFGITQTVIEITRK